MNHRSATSISWKLEQAWGAAAMDDGPPGILFIGIGCRGAVARALQVWYCLDTEPGFPTDSRDQLTDVRVPGWFVTLQSVFDRRP
jgi:hypothetical protein